MRLLHLTLASCVSVALFICLYCAYVLIASLFQEFDYSFDLDSRGPSLLPMTAILEYANATEHVIARYASFGPIVDVAYEVPLNRTFSGTLVLISNNACDLKLLQQLVELNEFYNKSNRAFDKHVFALNQRGGCSFYTKTLNLQKLGVSAVIIGNDQPGRGLLTMFSKNIPEDIGIPLVFITQESFIALKFHLNAPISIYTGQTPSPFLDALLTLVFSPPIALMVVFFVVKFRRYHRRRLERASKNAVSNLPVFVYNAEYLIPIKEYERRRDFYSDGVEPPQKPSLFMGLFKKGKSNMPLDDDEAPVPELRRHLSTEEFNQFHMGQCLICLNQFRRLKLKVVLLPCSHYFHYKCCINWLCNYHKTCPVCKHDITKKRKPRASIDSASSFAGASIMNIFRNEEENTRLVDRGTSPGLHELSYNAIVNEADHADDEDVSSNDIDYVEGARREDPDEGMADEEQSIENVEYF